jgi:hypothetical protein
MTPALRGHDDLGDAAHASLAQLSNRLQGTFAVAGFRKRRLGPRTPAW